LLTTKGGSVDFKIEAIPTITGVSNENPTTGDSVYVYGTYLKNIQSFTFGGATVTSFQSSADGSSVGFVSPSLTSREPISITTQFGSVTTIFPVNTRATEEGVLANMEWGNHFGWGWWGASGLTVNNAANSGGWISVKSDFDGVLGWNNTMFVSFNTSSIPGETGDSWGPYNFPIGGNQWVPAANLSEAVGNWALKFELSVSKPWNGGTLCFENGFAGGSYIARYEPWQVSATATAPFTTKGWQTVTIPLSSFRGADATLGKGKGASVASLTTLLGASGNTSLSIYLHNFSTSDTPTGFYAAIDNVRVVKIK
jgi:hypothetical protein